MLQFCFRFVNFDTDRHDSSKITFSRLNWHEIWCKSIADGNILPTLILPLMWLECFIEIILRGKEIERGSRLLTWLLLRLSPSRSIKTHQHSRKAAILSHLLLKLLGYCTWTTPRLLQYGVLLLSVRHNAKSIKWRDAGTWPVYVAL